MEGPNASTPESGTQRYSPEVARFRRTHPPLDRPFSAPDELKALQQLPRDERKDALAAFKRDLHTQREAWAACQMLVEERLEANPGASLSEVAGIINDFGPSYGFTSEQIQNAAKGLEEYRVARKRALEARARFPDDRELVQHLSRTAIDPGAKFDISIGPMTIDVVADEATAAKMYAKGDEEKIKSFDNIAGYATVSPAGEFYSVIVRERRGHEAIKTHEFQHQKNRIFQRVFEERMGGWDAQTIYDEYSKIPDAEGRSAYLDEAFEVERQHALDRAKDEFIAFATDGEYSFERIRNLFMPGANDAYDYLEPMRDAHQEDELWQERAHDHFVERYNRSLDTAAAAFQALERIYTRKETTALLTPVPIEDWSKFSARAYGEKLDEPMSPREVREHMMRKLAQERREREERQHRAVRDRLTRRAFLVGSPVAAAGALSAEKLAHTEEDEARIDANMENARTIETPHATYRLGYTAAGISANPELLNGSGALLVDQAAYADQSDASAAARERIHGSEQDPLTASGEIVVHPPEVYRNVLKEAERRRVPIYFVRSERPMRGQLDEPTAMAEGGMGALLGLFGIRSLANRPNRRGLFGGLAALAGSGYLLSPTSEGAAKVLEPHEPNVRGFLWQAEQSLKGFNERTHPELAERFRHFADVLMAEKAEWIASRLNHRNGKPTITLLVDRDNSGIEEQLARPARERMRDLEALGDYLPLDGTVNETHIRHGRERTRVLHPEQFGQMPPPEQIGPEG